MTAPSWSQEHGGHWLATSHEAICAVARDAEVFSSARSVHVPPSGLYARGIRIFALEHDGDEHWEQRQILAAVVGSKPAAVPSDLIHDCVVPLLDAIDWSERFDLVANFTNPLPLDVIFAIMGADAEFKPEMKALVDALLRRDNTNDPASRVHDIAREMVRRRRAEPQGDWITSLSTMPEDDQVAAVVSLITGGHHSTSRGLGSLLARVLSEPGLRDQVLDDPGLIDACIDETLRLHTPLPEFSRTAVRSSNVCGAGIEQGQAVSMRYDIGNRDAKVFDDPDAFSLDRRKSAHLAFGFGPHRCVGTHLARAEMQIALVAVLERAPSLTLMEDIKWAGPAEPEALWVKA